jgi:hypothetical protein
MSGEFHAIAQQSAPHSRIAKLQWSWRKQSQATAFKGDNKLTAVLQPSASSAAVSSLPTPFP